MSELLKLIEEGERLYASGALGPVGLTRAGKEWLPPNVKDLLNAAKRAAAAERRVDELAAALVDFQCFDLDEGDLRILMLGSKGRALSTAEDEYATQYGAIRLRVAQLDPAAILAEHDAGVIEGLIAHASPEPRMCGHLILSATELRNLRDRAREGEL